MYANIHWRKNKNQLIYIIASHFQRVYFFDESDFAQKSNCISNMDLRVSLTDNANFSFSLNLYDLFFQTSNEKFRKWYRQNREILLKVLKKPHLGFNKKWQLTRLLTLLSVKNVLKSLFDTFSHMHEIIS